MAVAERHLDWLDVSEIDALSSGLSEGEGPATARRRAASAFRTLPMEPNPLYRKYGYFAGVDLAGLSPRLPASAVEAPSPEPDTLEILHDASGTRVRLPSSLEAVGVRVLHGPELWNGPGAAAFLGSEEAPADRLAALARATLNRGYVLEVPDLCPRPVRLREILVLSQPHEALSVRRSIRLGRSAHLLASEEVYSTETGPEIPQRLAASDTDLTIGEEARVALLTLHAADPHAVSAFRRTAEVGPRARLAWVWSGFGGFRTRVRNRSQLTGQGSDVTDLQTFFGINDQAYDSAIDLVHLGTDTHGQSISRGVFRDQARGMSRGLVRIEKDARKTLSFLSEHAMLLSRGARSEAIPILEILCRDVKATHSSSVAPVDPERVFYLESRGISEDDAVRMIAEGFLSHVLERSPIGGLRELAYPYLEARWENRPLAWRPGAHPILPAIELTGAEGETDWRFDAKLR